MTAKPGQVLEGAGRPPVPVDLVGFDIAIDVVLHAPDRRAV
jgi:hypothetical protein